MYIYKNTFLFYPVGCVSLKWDFPYHEYFLENEVYLYRENLVGHGPAWYKKTISKNPLQMRKSFLNCKSFLPKIDFHWGPETGWSVLMLVCRRLRFYWFVMIHSVPTCGPAEDRPGLDQGWSRRERSPSTDPGYGGTSTFSLIDKWWQDRPSYHHHHHPKCFSAPCGQIWAWGQGHICYLSTQSQESKWILLYNPH